MDTEVTELDASDIYSNIQREGASEVFPCVSVFSVLFLSGASYMKKRQKSRKPYHSNLSSINLRKEKSLLASKAFRSSKIVYGSTIL